MSSPPARARRAAARTRREAARERIVAAAERLLRDRPYRELSVEEVMAEAGLSRTIFYRHFDGLPELVLSLFDTSRRR
jgi:AcrR family transcriptional regulator